MSLWAIVARQSGHPGSSLQMSSTPDLVIVHPVEACPYWQCNLREVESLHAERRHVIDLPPKRVFVIEHQAQQKCCSVSSQGASASAVWSRLWSRGGLLGAAAVVAL